MDKYRKRLVAIIAAISLVFGSMPMQQSKAIAWDKKKAEEQLGVRFYNNETPGYRFYVNAGERYILETVKEPKVGSIGGEWSVLCLQRGLYTGLDYVKYLPENYFENYVERVESYVEEKQGVLDRSKSTEWSRLILTLTALGKDITNVAGKYDFIDTLSNSYKFSYKQGINGPIWEVISMQCGDYDFCETPSQAVEGDENSYGKMIDYIVAKEITTASGKKGGFALTGALPDTDITAMALQALAPFYLDEEKYNRIARNTTYEELCCVVERGVLTLSSIQLANGGYQSWGSINSESVAQVIVALTALQMDPLAVTISLPHIQENCDFLTEGQERDGVETNNVIDNLLTFYANGSSQNPGVGGFRHVTEGYDGGGNAGTTVNAMATDQAVYALLAYDRFLSKKNRLYDMTDCQEAVAEKTYTLTLHGNKKAENVIRPATAYEVVSLPKVSGEYKNSFIGWNTKEDGTGISYLPGESLSMPEKDIVLYAQYGKQEFTITWELQGGSYTGSEKLPVSYVPEDTIALPTEEQMKKDGCLFKGWYKKTDGSKELLTGELSSQFGDLILCAQFEVDWQPIQKFYEIVNGLTLSDISASDETQVEYARKLYDEMAEIQRAEIIAGTYEKLVEAEKLLAEQKTETTPGGHTDIPVVTPKITAEITIAPTVPLQSNTPEATSSPQCTREAITTSEPEVQEIVTPVATTSVENTELPQSIAPSVTEEASATSMPVIEETPKLTSTPTPEVATRKITYVLAGGKNNPKNKNTYSGTKRVAIYPPQKLGYVFKGWYTEKSYKHKISYIEKGETKDFTLYAKWENAKPKELPVIKKLVRIHATTLKLQLKHKVKKADGYEIVYALDKKFLKEKKCVRTTTITTKLKKLKKKAVYYVKLRAYRKDSTGQKIYGEYSKVKHR